MYRSPAPEEEMQDRHFPCSYRLLCEKLFSSIFTAFSSKELIPNRISANCFFLSRLNTESPCLFINS